VTEEWRDVKGYEGTYQVSNLGRIKSKYKQSGGKILERKSDYGHYANFILCKNGIHKVESLHRIVADAFCENRSDKCEVNHKDMNRSNNRADNLEWVTRSENSRHAHLNKPRTIDAVKKYNQDLRPRELIQLTNDGEEIARFKNAKVASDSTGISRSGIWSVAAKRKTPSGYAIKTAGGYKWEFGKTGFERYGT
jgi:hypothetical protein